MTRPSTVLRSAVPARVGAIAVAAAMLVASFAAIPAAHAAPAVSSPCTSPCDIGDVGGPLTHVYIGAGLSCQVVEVSTVEYTGASSTSGDCGTYVAVNGKLYGPTISTSPSTATPYAKDFQTTSGDGSLPSPRQVTTQVHAGTLVITEVDTYAAGQNTYKTRITLKNTGTTALNGVRLYRAADCALGGVNTGFGNAELRPKGGGSALQVVSISCAATSSPGSAVESWVPNSVNANYFEGTPGTLWNDLGNGVNLPDTCSGSFQTAGPCGSGLDNAVGISWPMSVGTGGTVTRGAQTNLATDGATPLTMFVTPDKTAVDSDAADGYTITIHNPTTSPVAIDSITDYLKPNFVYRAGTTTGNFGTADPSGSGTLVWTGSPLGSVAARSDATLHFGVNVPNAGGKYTNAASATSGGAEVAPTGPSAQIVVTHTFQLTVHKAGTGTGTVSSSPAGINCGSTCTKGYTGGIVKLTAAKALGSRFAGWSGDCTGSAACAVTMGADHDVTATFNRVCTNIAYVSGTKIWTTPETGGSPTALVTSAGANYGPAWSPNCSKIAFTSTRTGIAQVFTMPAGGGTVTQITHGPRPSSQPTWSADGSKIAFTSTRSGKAQIYVVGAGGGTARRLTKDGAADTQPDWSPVGPRIVFTSTLSGRAQLYSILSNGKGLTRLTSSVGTNSQAAWSPTAARLLFISTRAGDPDVFVMNANGSNQIRLTSSKTFAESHPTWSPKGGSFAFTSNRSGNADVFTRTLAGTLLTNLTASDTAADTSPAWSS